MRRRPPSSEAQGPKWVRAWMQRMLDPRLAEATIGDLDEKLAANLSSGMSAGRARYLYVVEAFGFIRMARGWRSASYSTRSWHHFLVFSWRLFTRDKSYYIVSMVGLAVSLAAFMIIGLFISNELSFDRFHKDQDRIFRIATHLRINDVDFDLATSQFPAAAALAMEYPQVERTVRLYQASRFIQIGERSFEENVLFVDSAFFDVFSFAPYHGDVHSALNVSNHVVLTRESAIRYFGREDVVGDQLLLDGETMRVAAVIQTIPEQSHFTFDMLVPMRHQLAMWQRQSGLEGREYKWFWVGAYTYLKLRSADDANFLATGMRRFVDKYFPERLRGGYFELQPLASIHLKSHCDAELQPNGDFLYLQLFGALGITIMLMSAINLINLSYFKLSSRVREVGVRRFLGQSSWRIATQFLMESIVAGLASFALALVITVMALPWFCTLLNTHLFMFSTTGVWVIAGTCLLVVLVSALAIVKPAFSIARARLTIWEQTRKSTAIGRNLLTGVQVGLSFVVLTFAFVVNQQLEYFRSLNLGFDRSNVVVVHVNDDLPVDAIKTEWKRLPSVVAVSCAEPPGRGYSGWRFVPENGSFENPVMLPFTSADESFLTTMRISLHAGSDFRSDMRLDSLTPFLINRQAAIELGWERDAIGRRLSVFAPGRSEIITTGQVIGIVDDFHSESLHDPLKPVVIAYGQYSGYLLVRMSKVDEETIEHLQEGWKRFSPRPFQYTVLEDDLNALYENEDKLAGVVKFFTVVALYLTCYGLFAMSSMLFTARMKDVAIRKVFGARESSILRHFYSRYAAFTLIALVCGMPVSLWISNLWLQTFQFKAEVSSSTFLQAALIVLIVGMVSVSYYVSRVAWSNPLSFLKRD